MMREIFKIRSFLAIAIGVALFGTSAQASAQASIITWQPSVNLFQGATVETFIDNSSGTLAVAYNNTTDTINGNVNVNGVPFTVGAAGVTLVGSGTHSITINGGMDNPVAFQDGEFNNNANIFQLLRGGTFLVNSVTLGGLTPGNDYLIQVINNDARPSRDSSFLTGYSDGLNPGVVATSDLNNSPPGTMTITDYNDYTGMSTINIPIPPTFPETEAGDSIIGTFSATGASLSFDVFGSINGDPFVQGDGRAQINAIQLRDLGPTPVVVPEPSSLVLFGLMSVAMVALRRK